MRHVKTFMRLPWHFLALFTTAKSFRDNKVIGNAWLNRAGLHGLRLIWAHGTVALRRALLSGFVPAEDRRSFRNSGFVLKENFLPEAAFQQLVAEARQYQGESWQCMQGDTITWRAFLSPDNLRRLPACARLVRNKKYIGLLKYCGSKNERPLLYIQQIQNGVRVADRDDPQKKLHADTFHPTMKAWLFLEDVPASRGPFTYVPGSHRLTKKRLAWEYRRSLTASSTGDGYSEKGSFRVSDAELKSMGLPEGKSFAVKANTLVVADTFGFHRRGDVTEDQPVTRLEIWAMNRVSPFNPWPGLGIPFFASLRDRGFEKFLRYRDRRAKNIGKRASWHQAPPAPKGATPQSSPQGLKDALPQSAPTAGDASPQSPPALKDATPQSMSKSA